MSDNTIAELERKVAELAAIKVYDEDVRKAVDSLIGSMPSPDDMDVDIKVRLLMVRCKALTLLPSFSMEAERDCSAALKLQHNNPELWVLLSECLARRGANREACDALDNALRLDAKNVGALCHYSQLLRTLSSDSSLTSVERQHHLDNSVIHGKAAAAACPTSADGWHYYSIALLTKALSNGTNIAEVQKALRAVQQAARISPEDPDVRFNKGSIEGLLGNFGNAVCDFFAAYKADPKRLKGTRQMLENYYNILQRAKSRITLTRSAGGRTFASLLAKLPALNDAAATREVLEGRVARQCHVAFGVAGILSEPGAEPMVVLAAEKSGEFVLLLFYGLLPGAIKLNNTVVVLLFPASTSVRVKHDVPAIPFLEAGPHEATYTQIFVDNKTTIVNGTPIPDSMFVTPKVSSRMFI